MGRQRPDRVPVSLLVVVDAITMGEIAEQQAFVDIVRAIIGAPHDWVAPNVLWCHVDARVIPVDLN